MINISITRHWALTDRVLLLPILQDQDDWSTFKPMLGGQIDLLKTHLSGKKGEIHWLWQDGQAIVLLGIGDGTNANQVIRAFRGLAHRQATKLTSKIALFATHLTTQQLEWAINGLILSTYRIGSYKSEATEAHPFLSADATAIVYHEGERTAKTAIQKGKATAETQMSIMQLVNAPSNKKVPEVLAEWARQSAKANNYTATIFEKEKIEEIGLHGLLSVNRGSEYPARFIILEYKGEKATQKVGLVGKGVTFDTGGVSIKGAANMHFMKSDMGGAGAVLGTVELAAKLKLPVHLIGIVPATDNSVDALSIKPSDVIDTYSGKTIEIIDTDAEGRLILADGLTYMQKHYQPDVLIDLATLTGSAVRTLGYHAGALFSNDDSLAKALEAAGETTGERLWQLPMWSVYGEELHSDVADIRNLGTRPMSGAIHAAKFLEFFTDNHPKWAHMDIAGVAFSEAEFSKQKSSTAYGVRLLVAYLEGLVDAD
ncbi:MAG: leucyl aminopeptidase family protein [Bacteroidota bacterium]